MLPFRRGSLHSVDMFTCTKKTGHNDVDLFRVRQNSRSFFSFVSRTQMALDDRSVTKEQFQKRTCLTRRHTTLNRVQAIYTYAEKTIETPASQQETTKLTTSPKNKVQRENEEKEEKERIKSLTDTVCCLCCVSSERWMVVFPFVLKNQAKKRKKKSTHFKYFFVLFCFLRSR